MINTCLACLKTDIELKVWSCNARKIYLILQNASQQEIYAIMKTKFVTGHALELSLMSLDTIDQSKSF